MLCCLLIQVSEETQVRRKEKKDGKGKMAQRDFFCPYELERAIQFQWSGELILPQVLSLTLQRQIILVLFCSPQSLGL